MKYLVLSAALLLCVGTSNALPKKAGAPGSAIDDAIINAIENARDQFGTGWPAFGIPPLDPLAIQHMNINISSPPQLVVTGFAENILATGLSTFVIDYLHFNIITWNLKANFSLNLLKAAGDYSIDGMMEHIFPVYGQGPFTVNVTDIHLAASMHVSQHGFGVFQVSNVVLDFAIGGLNFNFEGLLGDEDLSENVNRLMSTIVYNQLVANQLVLEGVAANVFTTVINKVLANHPIIGLDKMVGHQKKLEGNGNANEYFDEVFANFRELVRAQTLDPIYIATDSDTFNVTLYNKTVGGSVEISNGHVSGLANVYRTGDCELTIEGNIFDMIVSAGANDIEMGVKLHMGVSFFATNLEVKLKLSKISLMVDGVWDLDDANTTLRDFQLQEIGTVEIDIKGIPLAGGLLSSLLNVAVNAVKDSMTYAFQELLKPFVQQIFGHPAFLAAIARTRV